MIKKREILKLGVGLVTSIGVGAIASNAIKMVRPREVGVLKDLCIGVGALVLASMASDKANVYTDEKIDELFDNVGNFFGASKDQETETVG